jgi:hypothetical protein
MTDKARKSQKKVKLERATASEIISSLRITRREARLAKAAVESVMGAGKSDRSSKDSPKSREAKV